MSLTAFNKKFSSFCPPRPICLEEPCNAWTGRVCGHSILFGVGACLYDDPERFEQREKRLSRKAMMCGASSRSNQSSFAKQRREINGFSLIPYKQNFDLIWKYNSSSYEFFYLSIKKNSDFQFNKFISRIISRYKVL